VGLKLSLFDNGGAAQLLNAVKEVCGDPGISRRTITLQKSERNDFGSFKLRKVEANDHFQSLWVGLDAGVPVLEFTKQAEPYVLEAITGWTYGLEDFCLFPKDCKSRDLESGELWFCATMLPY
jgi:hypothetical protein